MKLKLALFFLLLILLIFSCFKATTSVTQHPDDDEKPDDKPDAKPADRSLEEADLRFVEEEYFNDESNDKAPDLGNREDRFYILRVKNRTENDSDVGCMEIEDVDLIPPGVKGLKNFGEDCDPAPGASVEDKCKVYQKVEYELKDHTRDECLKPTHFACDPITKKCVCGLDFTVITHIRFQVGNMDGPNTTHGICLIRPTFEFLEGFHCAPGTKPEYVVLDNDDDDEDEESYICACINFSVDTFDSSDPNWWSCGGGNWIRGWKWIVVVTLSLIIITFS